MADGGRQWMKLEIFLFFNFVKILLSYMNVGSQEGGWDYFLGHFPSQKYNIHRNNFSDHVTNIVISSQAYFYMPHIKRSLEQYIFITSSWNFSCVSSKVDFETNLH